MKRPPIILALLAIGVLLLLLPTGGGDGDTATMPSVSSQATPAAPVTIVQRLGVAAVGPNSPTLTSTWKIEVPSDWLGVEFLRRYSPEDPRFRAGLVAVLVCAWDAGENTEAVLSFLRCQPPGTAQPEAAWETARECLADKNAADATRLLVRPAVDDDFLAGGSWKHLLACTGKADPADPSSFDTFCDWTGLAALEVFLTCYDEVGPVDPAPHLQLFFPVRPSVRVQNGVASISATTAITWSDEDLPPESDVDTLGRCAPPTDDWRETPLGAWIVLYAEGEFCFTLAPDYVPSGGTQIAELAVEGLSIVARFPSPQVETASTLRWETAGRSMIVSARVKPDAGTRLSIDLENRDWWQDVRPFSIFLTPAIVLLVFCCLVLPWRSRPGGYVRRARVRPWRRLGLAAFGLVAGGGVLVWLAWNHREWWEGDTWLFVEAETVLIGLPVVAFAGLYALARRFSGRHQTEPIVLSAAAALLALDRLPPGDETVANRDLVAAVVIAFGATAFALLGVTTILASSLPRAGKRQTRPPRPANPAAPRRRRSGRPAPSENRRPDRTWAIARQGSAAFLRRAHTIADRLTRRDRRYWGLIAVALLLAIAILAHWSWHLWRGAPLWHRAQGFRSNWYQALLFYPLNLHSQLPLLLPYVALAGLLAVLRGAGRGRTSLFFNPQTDWLKRALILLYAGFVVGTGGVLLGLQVPLAFVATLLLMPRCLDSRLARIGREIDDVNPRGVKRPLILAHRRDLLQRAQALAALRRRRAALFVAYTKGDGTDSAYRTRETAFAAEERLLTSGVAAGAGGKWTGLRLPAGWSPRQLGLAVGPMDSLWGNGCAALKRGLILAIVPVGYFVYVLTTRQVESLLRMESFGVITVLGGLLGELAFWSVAAFVLGGLYPYLWGANGALKGLALAIVFGGGRGIGVLTGAETETGWAVRFVQLLLFLVALGVWLDWWTVRRQHLNWRHLLDYYQMRDVRILVTYVSSLALTLYAIGRQVVSGDAGQAIVETLKSLPQILSPFGP